jgi:hypothetical protein
MALHLYKSSRQWPEAQRKNKDNAFKLFAA